MAHIMNHIGSQKSKGTQKPMHGIDMRFWWLKDRINQKQFWPHWKPGKENLADYTTKFNILAHHKRMQPLQLYIKDKSPSTLKGCIELMNEPTKNTTCPATLSHKRCMTQGTQNIQRRSIRTLRSSIY